MDRSALRRNLQAQIRDTEKHLEFLKEELDSVSENYVQVKFIEGFNESTEPSNYLYTYRDPSGELVVGDIVLAGFKNALARVEKLSRGDYDGQVKNITTKLEKKHLIGQPPSYSGYVR